MQTETETKLKVESLKKVAERLDELDAEFVAEQWQTDYYFDTAERTLTKTDSCLRLRRQMTGDDKKVILAFKGPKEKTALKRRQEIEIEIAGADSAAELLKALGYEKALVFEKKRRLWQLDDCEIALDELPLLGSFVEIEGPNEEKILGIQARLGLSGLPHILQSYASLMAERLRRQKV